LFAEHVAVGVPGHHVARVDDLVFLDAVLVAVPQAQTVAAHAEGSGLEEMRLLRTILSFDCLRSMPNRQLSMTSFSRVLRWPRTSRQESSVSCESPEPCKVSPRSTARIGLQQEHRALAAGVDDDLAAAVDDERLVEADGPA
jgi:hypothetical protein